MPLPPLEQQRLPGSEVHDRLHGVLHGVDEAGGALRRLLDAHVEPDGAVEGGVLVDEEVAQLAAEGLRLGAGEVATLAAPARDRIDHAIDQLAHGSLPRRRPSGPVEVLGDHDVGCVQRPAARRLHVRLLEDNAAAVGGDRRGAPLPLQVVVGMAAGLGVTPLDQCGVAGVRGLARDVGRGFRLNDRRALVVGVRHGRSSQDRPSRSHGRAVRTGSYVLSAYRRVPMSSFPAQTVYANTRHLVVSIPSARNISALPTFYGRP